jgi:quaternary ammonium compound-resistance protein SugE
MYWIILLIAGFFEAAFATSLGMAHETKGRYSFYWLIMFLITLAISMVLLYIATKKIPIGTAYAVWTGIGAVSTAIVGIVLFKEPAGFWRLFFIFTLIASIVGLKAVSQG